MTTKVRQSTQALPESKVITTTGNIDDLDFGNAAQIIFNNASLSTLRGLKAGTDGQIVTIVSIGAGEVDLAHQNTNSSASNRLINYVTSGITPLAAGSGTCQYQYDGTTSRWRLVNHEQGDWITVTFNSANFSGASGMTWTVIAGNVLTNKFKIDGRRLLWNFQIINTTVGGTPSSDLIAVNPLSYQANDSNVSMMFASDNGSRVVGFSVNSFLSATQIGIVKLDGTSWTASIASTAVECANITMSLV